MTAGPHRWEYDSPAAAGTDGHWTDADRLRALQPIPPKSEHERARNKPRVPLKVHPRHYLMNTRPKSKATRLNGLVEPWVPMAAEIEAINRGDGEKLSEIDYRINGRVYRVKNVGSPGAFPLSGPGIHTLTQAEYRALTILIENEQYEARALAIIRSFRGNPVTQNRLDLVHTLARVVFLSRGSERL